MAAQSAHASVEAVLKSDQKKVKKWQKEGQKKVILKVKDKDELYRYCQDAKDNGLKISIITDAGRTVVEPGTVTCGAIGPDEESLVDQITQNLKMM